MSFPIKQVHLDFHTSPDIKGIGSKFNKKQFQAALKEAKLESITVFAKCHHGLSYYPTEIGKMHPGLSFDLTGAEIEACHEIGVRAPVYITAGWSEWDSSMHPEWVSRNKNGEMNCTTSRKDSFIQGEDEYMDHCSWVNLCLNDGSYCEYIYKITEEVCKRYKDLDGLFYDICFIDGACYCDECVKGMKEMGLDPQNEADARFYYIEKHKSFMFKCGEILHKYHPEATIFFNSGGADMDKPQYFPYESHFEMEDLPTVWGGYDKMPIRAKFFKETKKPYIGMTGKFHTNWGEFGGFKDKDALKFEITYMAMCGAGCSVGDHVHPDCEMEWETYKNIGYAYSYLDKIAPFCYGGESTANLGIVLGDNGEANEGLSCILLENQIDYDVIFDNNFDKYNTVVMPTGVKLSDEGADKLKAYINNGGKLLFMGNSLVRDNEFIIDIGADYIGKSEYDWDYITTDLKPEAELPDAPMLCYFPAENIKLTDGEVLASILLPYFNRTKLHYCGHQNTPHNKEGEIRPSIVKKGNVIYMAHSMSGLYKKYGSIYYKRYVMAALGLLYTERAFCVEGLLSQGRAMMNKQKENNRYCLNLLYGIPTKRGMCEIIEDMPDIYNVKITLNIEEEVKNVYLGVSKEKLEFSKKEGKTEFVLPKLHCHESIVIEY